MTTSYRVLIINNDTRADDIFKQIDNSLTIVGDGPPTGTVSAAKPGIWYYDKTNKVIYASESGDGTLEGTSWIIMPFAADYEDVVDNNPPVNRFITAPLAKRLMSELSKGNPNLLFNGDLEWWSRGISARSTSSGSVTKSSLIGPEGVLIYREGLVTGCKFSRVVDSKNRPNIRITRDSLDPNTNTVIIEFPIYPFILESIKGKRVTLTFNALKSSLFTGVSNKVTVNLVVGSGSTRARLNNAFTSEVNSINTDITLLESEQTFSITGLIPTNIEVASVICKVVYSGIGQSSDYFQVNSIKLEEGEYYTPTTLINKEYEKVIKSRIINSSFNNLVNINHQIGEEYSRQVLSNNAGRFIYQLPINMWDTPDINIYNPVNLTNNSVAVWNGSTHVDSSYDSASAENNIFRLYGGTSVARENGLIKFHYYLSSEII